MIGHHRVMLASLILCSSCPGALTAGTRNTHAAAISLLNQASGLQPADGLPVKCGLPALAYARQHRHDGQPTIQEALQTLETRPVLQASLVVGRFRIHFDTAGVNTPSMLDPTHQHPLPGTALEYVDSAASCASYVYELEVDSLGYSAPPLDDTLGGGPEYDLYIVNLSASGNPGVYGYTAPDSPTMVDGGRSSTFIVLDNEFAFLANVANRGLPAMHVTLAHEFHHAIQIGGYGYWGSEIFYHEITSVWMESVAYPGVDDYLQYVQSGSGQFANPGIPFEDNGQIMYSRGIWGHFIAKRFGSVAMRHSWEAVRTDRPLVAIDNALSRYNSTNFASTFAEWELWNYFTGTRADTVLYYPQGNRYRLVVSSPIGYAGSLRQIPGSVAPLAAAYLDVSGGSQPLSLAVVNIDYSVALGGGTSPETYTMTLSPVQPDATFRATLAGIYVKLESPNTGSWWNWDIVNGIVGTRSIDETAPYPNPYVADGVARVYIPTTELEGNLTIYSTGMTLIYQSVVQSVRRLGRPVFSWNGETNSNHAAASGVYIYTLTFANRMVTGKISLLRKH